MKKISFIAVCSSLLFGVSTSALAIDFPHLTTSGYGEVIAKPDMATFSVSVVESTMTAEQAKSKVDDVVERFIRSLKQAGVSDSDIASSNLYLTPQYHYPKDERPELVGYRASRNVTVTVKVLDKLNKFLEVALVDGINQIDNIQLKVSDEATYQEQARQAAIRDANQKAQSLAKGFNKELNDVWEIRYNNNNTQPVLLKSMKMDSSRIESDSYQDSSITIRDRVEVVYKLDD